MYEHLYIHVPFCTSKCAYCAFYSETGASGNDISAWLEKLKSDFSLEKDNCLPLKSIYIGGGTPSSLPDRILSGLFSSIRDNFRIESGAEISVECNPETVTKDKAALLASFASRISLGLQSSRQTFRDVLGRAGSPDSFCRALEFFTDAGIVNIGADLIYAIPGQTLKDWTDELDKTASAGITHLSAYSLTLEEGSRLAESGAELSSDELSADMWLAAGETLSVHGFSRYEISNYAKDRFRCLHNSSIWKGETYLGCGPAASSFDGKTRRTQQSNLKNWLNGSAPEIDLIGEYERTREIFVIGLRALAGWSKTEFMTLRNTDFNLWHDKLYYLASVGLLDYDGRSVRPTEKGLLFWNSLAEELI